MNRLHDKGYIGNPKNKTNSVFLPEEGQQRTKALFQQHVCEKRK